MRWHLAGRAWRGTHLRGRAAPARRGGRRRRAPRGRRGRGGGAARQRRLQPARGHPGAPPRQDVGRGAWRPSAWGTRVGASGGHLMARPFQSALRTGACRPSATHRLAGQQMLVRLLTSFSSPPQINPPPGPTLRRILCPGQARVGREAGRRDRGSFLQRRLGAPEAGGRRGLLRAAAGVGGRGGWGGWSSCTAWGILVGRTAE
jgi:hypothetical protein